MNWKKSKWIHAHGTPERVTRVFQLSFFYVTLYTRVMQTYAMVVRPDENSNNYKSASYIRNYDFIGLVRGYDSESGLYIVEQRNKMSIGDKIEVIGPYKETMFTTIEEMYDEEGNPIESAPHARQIVKMKVGLELKENYILRKPIEKTRIL